MGLGMVAATRPSKILGRAADPGRSDHGEPRPVDRSERSGPEELPGLGMRVGVLSGCVQGGLFRRVNRATERVLVANGFEVYPAPGQGCCGALHAHGGDLEGARNLARRNIRAFETLGPDLIAVNAAGCGAAMKDYPQLLEEDEEYAVRASAFAAKVRDVSELLGRRGVRQGGSLAIKVTYDAPCHLIHAQGITEEPLALLGSIPGLELIPMRKHDECCGGAGIYGITHPELGGRISHDKVLAILETGAELVATGNPGCMMQIGAGLRAMGEDVEVVHPVELLDESYRRGGVYP